MIKSSSRIFIVNAYHGPGLGHMSSKYC